MLAMQLTGEYMRRRQCCCEVYVALGKEETQIKPKAVQVCACQGRCVRDFNIYRCC